MAKTESGVCILCGRETKGTPAGADRAVLFFRKMRALLRLPESHSIACGDCIAECREKRQRFERKVSSYRLYALLFLLFVPAGGLFFGAFTLYLLLPAVLGALIILALPYAYYFPEF